MKEMKKAGNIVLLVVLLIAASAFAYGQSANAVEQAVLKLEQERVDAAIKGDLATLERIFADDLIYTHSNARVESKQQFLEAVKSGSTKYLEMKHGDLKAQVYGDTVVLRGKSDVKVSLNGQPPVSLQLRILIVYVKLNNRWQMTTWQSTRLAAQ
jgi:ketosteroid isomerase-like protein